MNLKITPIDESKIEGAEAKYHGVILVIARAQNEKFIAAFRHYTKGIDTANMKVSSDEFEEATMKAMADAILVGWRNFIVGGEEIPYTKENAFNLLKNDPDVREFVSGYSNKIANYLIDDKDDLVGK